ncbi:hypothetical protein ACM25N_10360 [Roseovarius sp. C7]|uniref:hypothetical protein n=1 Tax=Roseovarius sp. C7 TaxID=3398643 RepID=UPI0039F6FEEB
MAHDMTLKQSLSASSARRQARIARLVAMVLTLLVVIAIFTSGSAPTQDPSRAADQKIENWHGNVRSHGPY